MIPSELITTVFFLFLLLLLSILFFCCCDVSIVVVIDSVNISEVESREDFVKGNLKKEVLEKLQSN